jgi:hypothetical protein
MSVAVAEQLRGDRVAVGLVANQDVAQVVAEYWIQLESSARRSSSAMLVCDARTQWAIVHRRAHGGKTG